MNRAFWLSGVLSVSFVWVLTVASAFAQPIFNVNTSIVSCDEYATKVLNNPWDMSDSADINNFTSNDVQSMNGTSFSSGIFNFNNAEAAGGHFSLISPQIDSLQPVGGRWGHNFPIDSAKYRHLTVRMNLAVADPSNFGLRTFWQRGKSGAPGSERTITNLGSVPTVKGWRSYSVDLSAINSFDGVSSNAKAWTHSPIHGIGLYPLVSTGGGQIDFIRLDDPSTCGSTAVAYASTASGNNDLISFYLDDDSNPGNGFLKKLSNSVTAASGDNLAINSLGMMPGSYKLVARFDSDYAGLERDNLWDMNEDTDVSSTGGITGATFSGGSFFGTADQGANIFFDVPAGKPIDASKYTKLSLKISTSTNTNTNPMLLVGERSGGGLFTAYLSRTGNDPDNDNVYHLDLSSEGSWSGQITSLRLQVTTTGTGVPANFSLDFLQIRKTGLVTSESSGLLIVSAGTLTISDPPRVQVLQPDVKGGELFRAWDIRNGDVGLSVNVDSGPDNNVPGEPRTAYLPDVRSVDGVRGNIYKSTNIAGNGDPNDFMNFPAAGNNRYTINADEYQNLCVRMMLNRDYDLTLGSVTKHFYKRTDGEFEAADAWATIYDRWSSSRWYEYCLDAKNHPTESNQINWGGTLEAFRIDPHEFSYDNCCDSNFLPFGNPINATTYYDYIRLAKRDRSYGKFALAWQSQDSDTATPSITWQYAPSADFSSPTTIGGGNLNCEGRVCIWNTAGVPNGEYHVRAVVSDGTNSNTGRATGTLVVANGQGAVETAPVLSVQSPSSNAVICSDMQVKGYAVNNSIDEAVVAVQIFIDSTFQQLVVPSEYSPASNAAYPARISDTGFNLTVPVFNLSPGTHTVTLKAYTSNGGVAVQNISVNKQTGCNDLVVSDPAPSGSPQQGAGSPPTPTPTPPTPPAAPKLSKATLSKTGVVQMIISGVNQGFVGCSLNVLSGAAANSQTSLKSFPVVVKDRTKGKITLKATGFKVNPKKLKRVFLGARYVCKGIPSATSSRSVKMVGSGSITKIAAFNKRLKSALKKS